MENSIYIGIIMVLLGVNGYWLRRLLTKSDKIESDVSDMKPKVQIMWEIMINLAKGSHLTEALREKLKE